MSMFDIETKLRQFVEGLSTVADDRALTIEDPVWQDPKALTIGDLRQLVANLDAAQLSDREKFCGAMGDEEFTALLDAMRADSEVVGMKLDYFRTLMERNLNHPV